MSSTIKTVFGFTAGVGTLAAATILSAGPTAPPAGPVAPTYKTLGEVEPRRAVQSLAGNAAAQYVIDQPGSYYLTGNIQGVSGKDGILVTASNVTIDLAGFTLAGASGSLNAVEAQATPAVSALVVVNGTISAWGNSGVHAPGVVNARMERLVVAGCGASPSGIGGGTGVYLGNNAAVLNCQAAGNGGAGIIAGVHSTIADCVVTGNTLYGIYADKGSRISGCDSSGNANIGIGSQEGTLFSRCTAAENQGDGFYTVGHGTFESCTAYLNVQNGFEIGRGATVTACSASRNLGAGIYGSQMGNMITNCTVSQNAGDGIRVQDQSTVEGCTSVWNGTTNSLFAGIHAVGSANRIDGNKVDNNQIGIRVDGTGNFIVRNTAAYNPTRTQIAASNDSAQWIIVPGANFVSTDPWANYGH
jgi:parallel beta-helix repeat protein